MKKIILFILLLGASCVPASADESPLAVPVGLTCPQTVRYAAMIGPRVDTLIEEFKKQDKPGKIMIAVEITAILKSKKDAIEWIAKECKDI